MTSEPLLDPEEPLAPRGRVAHGTPPWELERLALQEALHPDADPLLVQGAIWIMRAYNVASGELADALRPLELSPSGFNVLQTLANTRTGELEPCQLAERLLVSRPSMTGLIDTLEAKRLVARRPHPVDRRRVLVVLTSEGRKMLECHYQEHYARLRALFSDLEPDEVEQLVVLLRKVHRSAEKRATPVSQSGLVDGMPT